MGFKNSPMILQRCMNRILEEYVGLGVEVYLDDFVIYAVTRKEHDIIIRKVLKKLVDDNFHINFNKIQYAQNKVKLLGVTVNGNEIMPLEQQKMKIKMHELPKNLREARGFLRLVNWFRPYIKDLAGKTVHLTNTLKVSKGLKYTKTIKGEEEFNLIKNKVENIDRVRILYYEKEIVLRTDASNIGIGAVLIQKNEYGVLVPIEWASKKLTPTESRYGITEKEMLDVKFV